MQDGVDCHLRLSFLSVRIPRPLFTLTPLLLHHSLASSIEELALTVLNVSAPLSSVLVSALSVRHGSVTFHLAVDEFTLVNIAIALGQLSLAHNDTLLEVALVQVARLIKEVGTLTFKQAILKVSLVSASVR